MSIYPWVFKNLLMGGEADLAGESTQFERWKRHIDQPNPTADGWAVEVGYR